MLTFEDKVKYFKYILYLKEKSYADSFDTDILIAGENYEYEFLDQFETKEQILYWIERLKGKLVMYEDEEVIEEIIEEFIFDLKRR